jgi:hypothetical protein
MPTGGINVIREMKRGHSRLRAALIVSSLLVGGRPAHAQCQVHKAVKLTASDAAAFDYFGRSVFVGGDVAIVGAVYDDCAGERR